jgi:hypothetical protein
MKSPIVTVIPECMILRDRGRATSERGLGHAEGADDLRSDELAEGVSAHTSDDAREQVVAAVVVAEFGGRHEIDASLPGEGSQNVLVDVEARRRRRREFDEQERDTNVEIA